MTEVLPLAPQAVAEWMPFAKAAGFFFATFILEDVAAIGAGLLLAAGQISWPAAFLACFLGIWLGDAGLYALARWAGRGWFERSPLKKFSGKVTESEEWFAERGTVILVFSRLIPGARLPTYLAAGFLRVPIPRFLLVTGLMSLGWTFLILWLVQMFGARLTSWLGTYKHVGLLLVAAGLILLGGLQWLRQRLTRISITEAGKVGRVAPRAPNRAVSSDGARGVTRPTLSRRFGRWRHWEFWPAWLFYPPVGIYCLWLAVKYRGLTLPTASNPGIFSGGMVGESKHAMLKELLATSPEFTAEAVVIPQGDMARRAEILERAAVHFGLRWQAKRDTAFPRADSTEEKAPSPLRSAGAVQDAVFILKPDVGQRGVGIKLIRTREQAEDYLRRTSAPLIAQRYAPGPHEAGIFYYRFPHETRGRIFAITEKIFPKLVGDGRHTIRELIERDPRARFVAATYLKRFAARRDEVLAAGEELKLVEAGNHAQGCIFRDGMRFRTPELERRIDEISQRLTGFFIGRYDIRYASEDDLRAGRNFQIIELNGAASEATSIYDARNSLWAAYRVLFQQWDLVFAIGAANRSRGCAPTKLALVWQKWREHLRLAQTYPVAD